LPGVPDIDDYNVTTDFAVGHQVRDHNEATGSPRRAAAADPGVIRDQPLR